VRFTCLDAFIPQLHGTHGDEQMFSVFLEFCTLMDGNGIFQRQLVQAEFFAQPGDSLAIGGLQLDPDETIGMGNVLADVVKCNRLNCGIVEEQAVDDGLRQR